MVLPSRLPTQARGFPGTALFQGGRGRDALYLTLSWRCQCLHTVPRSALPLPQAGTKMLLTAAAHLPATRVRAPQESPARPVWSNGRVRDRGHSELLGFRGCFITSLTGPVLAGSRGPDFTASHAQLANMTFTQCCCKVMGTYGAGLQHSCPHGQMECALSAGSGRAPLEGTRCG